MTIRKMQEQDIPAVASLYNSLAEKDFVHKRLTPEAFRETFWEADDRTKKLNWVATWQDGERELVVGFASGALVAGRETGYVSFVLVDPTYRRKGAGTQLMHALERDLVETGSTPGVSAEGKPLKNIQMIFFNPVALTWVVPGTPGHDHPNAPGVDVAADAYLFFKNVGYIDRVTQNSYYLPLDRYAGGEELMRKLETLKQKGFAIGYYDPAMNDGLKELCDDLGSEDWSRELLGNTARGEQTDPLIVAIKAKNPAEIVTDHLGKCAGTVVGFTGPIHVQPSGRGYFAGIGVHSAYRKEGLGTSLFTALCQGQKENGAAFMTLFTGEQNPARRIYQGAGFKIVKTWSDMIKEV